MLTKYTQVYLQKKIEKTGNIKRLKHVIFLFHGITVFGKLGGIKKQYCSITTQLVYCLTLYSITLDHSIMCFASMKL